MDTQELENDAVKSIVRERYGRIAEQGGSSGCAPTCCAPDQPSTQHDPVAASRRLGYSPEQTNIAPEGSNLGLGCGNPQVIAALKPGEIVLDLGSGAGFDAFLAARAVGRAGRVIGVDMTPEMISKARWEAPHFFAPPCSLSLAGSSAASRSNRAFSRKYSKLT